MRITQAPKDRVWPILVLHRTLRLDSLGDGSRAFVAVRTVCTSCMYLYVYLSFSTGLDFGVLTPPYLLP